MGVNTDVTATPFQPIAPKAGMPPSGVNNQSSIRGLANDAKKRVSDKMNEFRMRMQNNAPVPETSNPQQAQQGRYVSAAHTLNDNHDVVDRFVDWVLFGR